MKLENPHERFRRYMSVESNWDRDARAFVVALIAAGSSVVVSTAINMATELAEGRELYVRELLQRRDDEYLAQLEKDLK